MLGKKRKSVDIAALAVTAMLSTTAMAADLPIYTGGYSINLPVESMKESRFRSVVRQKYDFSCGSAAVATLLNYHYAWPADEQEILLSMMALGDREKIRKEGFSLLDMKRYLASIGFKANGFRATLDKLKTVGIPAIALINHNGYLHFVVIKGVREDNVLLGDPALGTRVVARDKFNAMWNQILFVIMNDKELGRSTFDRDDEWQLTPNARFDAALSDRSLSSFTVQISPTPNYYF